MKRSLKFQTTFQYFKTLKSIFIIIDLFLDKNMLLDNLTNSLQKAVWEPPLFPF